jgi:hypothetical protein
VCIPYFTICINLKTFITALIKLDEKKLYQIHFQQWINVLEMHQREEKDIQKICSLSQWNTKMMILYQWIIRFKERKKDRILYFAAAKFNRNVIIEQVLTQWLNALKEKFRLKPNLSKAISFQANLVLCRFWDRWKAHQIQCSQLHKLLLLYYEQRKIRSSMHCLKIWNAYLQRIQRLRKVSFQFKASTALNTPFQVRRCQHHILSLWRQRAKKEFQCNQMLESQSKVNAFTKVSLLRLLLKWKASTFRRHELHRAAIAFHKRTYFQRLTGKYRAPIQICNIRVLRRGFLKWKTAWRQRSHRRVVCIRATNFRRRQLLRSAILGLSIHTKMQLQQSKNIQYATRIHLHSLLQRSFQIWTRKRELSSSLRILREGAINHHSQTSKRSSFDAWIQYVELERAIQNQYCLADSYFRIRNIKYGLRTWKIRMQLSNRVNFLLNTSLELLSLKYKIKLLREWKLKAITSIALRKNLNLFAEGLVYRRSLTCIRWWKYRNLFRKQFIQLDNFAQMYYNTRVKRSLCHKLIGKAKSLRLAYAHYELILKTRVRRINSFQNKISIH